MTIDDAAGTVDGNKEPWLAASFSLLVPGAGQLYCGFWCAGIALMFLWTLLSVGLVGSLIALQVPTVVLVAVFLAYFALWIGAILAAFLAAKRGNTADFESRRTQGRDPWRAVFYNLVVPGVGHLYLGRWFIGGVAVTLAGALAGRPSTYSGIALVALRTLAAFHVHFIASDYRPKPRRPLILLAALVPAVSLLNGPLMASLVIRPYVGEVYLISGQSMAPTLWKGTRIVANKLTYRWHEPAVGDIAVLTPPDHPLVIDRTVVCHRIVAIGGQTVQVRGGFVWIDGEYAEPHETPHRFITSIAVNDKNASYFAYGVSEPYRVPEGCYFVLGDNRAISLDSRGYGAMPRKSITGKVVRVLWPLNTLPLYDKERR